MWTSNEGSLTLPLPKKSLSLIPPRVNTPSNAESISLRTGVGSMTEVPTMMMLLLSYMTCIVTMPTTAAVMPPMHSIL